MGSAVALALARRGLRVIGFDRFRPPHALGSSHGATRIIREAYFEHPTYVPMVQHALERWRALEHEVGTRLLTTIGGLMIGHPDSDLVVGARRSALQHGLAHELLSRDAVEARFPALRLQERMVAVWEPNAGVLLPEACISAQLMQTQRFGAQLHFDEPVVDWEADPAGVRVWTTRGEHRAHQLVIAAGAWVNALLADSPLPVQVERQVLVWFAPIDPAPLAPARCPIHLWQYDGRRFFYGFPDLGDGVKASFHHGGEPTTAEAVRREVGAEEIDAVRAAVRRFLPAADGPVQRTAVCLYTNTPDEHFWIDRHPCHEQVVVVSACSGHGFKFAPTIGEVVADLVQERPARFDLSLFRRR